MMFKKNDLFVRNIVFLLRMTFEKISLKSKCNLFYEILNYHSCLLSLTLLIFAEIKTQKLLPNLPATCSESNENGIQLLSNGEKVYCDRNWTVSLEASSKEYVLEIDKKKTRYL